MSRATIDDQLKFLLVCVQHSNHGKVDFTSVAKECGVTSRGAATKRYNRLLRNNGFEKNGREVCKSEKEHAVKRKSNASIAKAAEAKRRKIEGDHNDPLADDGAPARPVKCEPGIKQEQSFGMLSSVPYAAGYMGQQIQGHGSPLLSGYPTQGSCSYGTSQAAEPRAPVIKLEDDGELHGPPPTPAKESSAPRTDDDSIFEDFCTSELFMPSEQQLAGASKNGKAGTAAHSTPRAMPSSSPCSVIRNEHLPVEAIDEKPQVGISFQGNVGIGNVGIGNVGIGKDRFFAQPFSTPSAIPMHKTSQSVQPTNCVVVLD